MLRPHFINTINPARISLGGQLALIHFFIINAYIFHRLLTILQSFEAPYEPSSCIVPVSLGQTIESIFLWAINFPLGYLSILFYPPESLLRCLGFFSIQAINSYIVGHYFAKILRSYREGLARTSQ